MLAYSEGARRPEPKLSDKYTLERGRVYLTGIQALVRLPIDQMRRDRRAGLKTGAFISGYEGSPLGGYDMALARADKLLIEHNIHFRPGVNEDLAATSVMGSQIFEVIGKTKVDGVVGIWYGKGPGVDRSGDIFRHANLAGTGKNCAALVLCGDDHISKSSTIPHQSDFSLYNLGIPFLYPGNTQEIIDYGLLAIAALAILRRLGRHENGHRRLRRRRHRGSRSGPAANSDSGRLQENTRSAPGRAHHAGARTRSQHSRVSKPRAQFARLNQLNRWHGARRRAWASCSAGKSYYDLMQALRDLGVGEATGDLGIGRKVGMTVPARPGIRARVRRGPRNHPRRRRKAQLPRNAAPRHAVCESAPAVLGKFTARCALPAESGELDPDKIAHVLGGVP